MASAALKTKMTPEEYLAFERASEEKHEYADGEIFAMSGGTAAHSEITANLSAELKYALRPLGCRVFSPDLRVQISANGRYVYPDGSVVCGEMHLLDEHHDTLLNPRLVFEVLSDSSEAYDRGDKFAGYRTIPSLGTYVLASQKKMLIEVFSRLDNGSWALRAFGPGEQAFLPDLGISIDVNRVYDGVRGFGEQQAG